ncbi:MAG: hypothetical protein RMM08_13890, partial [Armatimonadota bacterium]|nr:hypothetical protein [Armatimonadota bacterium]
RLSEHRQPAHTSRIVWWQWSAATAAVACALVLGIAWWGSYTPVSERPRGQNFASSERQAGTPAAPGAESPVYSLSTPTRSPAVKPVRTAKAPPVKSNEPPPLSMRLAARATAQPAEPVVQPAPQAYASVAYAEVRNEQGELVSRLLLQTTYDQNGQPRSVQIEYDASAAVEVENDDNPMDSSDTHDNSRGSAGSPTAAADSGTRLSD